MKLHRKSEHFIWNFTWSLLEVQISTSTTLQVKFRVKFHMKCADFLWVSYEVLYENCTSKLSYKNPDRQMGLILLYRPLTPEININSTWDNYLLVCGEAATGIETGWSLELKSDLFFLIHIPFSPFLSRFFSSKQTNKKKKTCLLKQMCNHFVSFG